MAPRVPPSPPVRPNLTVEQKRRAVSRLEGCIEELTSFDARSVSKRWNQDPRVHALTISIDEALSNAFGHGTVEYKRYERAAKLDQGPIVMGEGDYTEAEEARQYIAEGKEKSIALLQQAIRSLNKEIEEDAAVTSHGEQIKASPRDLSKVFIVHGHDGEVENAVARFIEKIGLEPVILHERPNKGRPLITKFREEAEGVDFAVVLMTPDDVGKANSAADLNPRARQNVVFELGFFIGALGPQNVAAIVRGNIERPSDYDGVVYIAFEEADWFQKLAQELQAAGYNIDWNKVMRR